MEQECILQYRAKGENTRICIEVLKQGDDFAIAVHSKKLNDKKSRKISNASVLYSFSTISVIAELIQEIKQTEVYTKNLHRFEPKKPFSVSTWIKNK